MEDWKEKIGENFRLKYAMQIFILKKLTKYINDMIQW